MRSAAPVDLSEVIYGAWWAAKKPGLKGTPAAWLTDNDGPGCRYVLRSDLWRGHYHRLRPCISSKGSRERSAVGEHWGGHNYSQEGRGKKMKRDDVRLPWCRMELISQFRARTVNTLLFHPCSWPEPVTCPWSLMILPWFPAQGCRAGCPAGCRPCNSQASRSPATVYWFLFPPNLQERSKEKIKNTVSLKLNKNPAQGRYLGEEGGHSWGSYISL